MTWASFAMSTRLPIWRRNLRGWLQTKRRRARPPERLQSASAHGARQCNACGDRTLVRHIRRYAPRVFPADCRAPRFSVRVSISNIRFRQCEVDAPPPDCGARASEARMRPKNIRPIGSPRPVLRRQTSEVARRRLTLHRRRATIVSQRSKVSSSDCRTRLFEARMSPAEVRARPLAIHAPAKNARVRHFQADVRPPACGRLTDILRAPGLEAVCMWCCGDWRINA